MLLFVAVLDLPRDELPSLFSVSRPKKKQEDGKDSSRKTVGRRKESPEEVAC